MARPAVGRPPSRLALPVAAALVALLSPPAPAQVFTDNFNSGTDAGWTHYQPLQPLGAGGTWSFPGGNTYRIQAAHTPSLGTLGPGRAGSVRTNLTYTDFNLGVDVVNWDNTVPQSFGLAARLSNIGLGTTNGYLFFVDSTGGLDIYRVDGEVTHSIASDPLSLLAGASYRFTFRGVGGTFTGQVFDLANPTVPLATVTNAAPDTAYASGSPGLVVAENTSGPISGADATFDNFSASPVPEPGSWALVALAAAGGWCARRRAARRPAA
jgi:hypothetical protein